MKRYNLLIVVVVFTMLGNVRVFGEDTFKIKVNITRPAIYKYGDSELRDQSPSPLSDIRPVPASFQLVEVQYPDFKTTFYTDENGTLDKYEFPMGNNKHPFIITLRIIGQSYLGFLVGGNEGFPIFDPITMGMYLTNASAYVWPDKIITSNFDNTIQIGDSEDFSDPSFIAAALVELLSCVYQVFELDKLDLDKLGLVKPWSNWIINDYGSDLVSIISLGNVANQPWTFWQTVHMKSGLSGETILKQAPHELGHVLYNVNHSTYEHYWANDVTDYMHDHDKCDDFGSKFGHYEGYAHAFRSLFWRHHAENLGMPDYADPQPKCYLSGIEREGNVNEFYSYAFAGKPMKRSPESLHNWTTHRIGANEYAFPPTDHFFTIGNSIINGVITENLYDMWTYSMKPFECLGKIDGVPKFCGSRRFKCLVNNSMSGDDDFWHPDFGYVDCSPGISNIVETSIVDQSTIKVEFTPAEPVDEYYIVITPEVGNEIRTYVDVSEQDVLSNLKQDVIVPKYHSYQLKVETSYNGASVSGPSLQLYGIGFLVNTNDDDDDGNCGAYHCSLREAINAANADPRKNEINFNIPGSSPHTIQPSTPLPVITVPVIIDGATSQHDFSGTPVIEIDGSQIVEANGLEITAGNSTVRGLVINNCGAAGIYLHVNGENVIEGNYLGTDVTGTLSRSNHLSGVHIMDVPNNIIGGSSSGSGNIISGNEVCGIWIEFPNAKGNIIQGNSIGLAANGADPLGNGEFGIKIQDASQNMIGGNSPGEGNIISANGKHGILINNCGAGSNNIVQGNYIGTDIDGTNTIGNGWSGVVILNSEDALVGGTKVSARNIIAGNRYGVRLYGNDSHNNLVQGNYIGTDFSGMIALPNRSAGVFISHGAYNNTIGGNEAGTGNVISGNQRGGVYIGFGANNNMVQGNLIGTDKSGAEPLGNTTDGISIFQKANDNMIGGDEEGTGNIIAFNAGVGVLVNNDPSPVRNCISRNSIHSNGDIGIDLSLSTGEPFTDGVTVNDPGDADIGSNELQNFPVLSHAYSTWGYDNSIITTVDISINSTPETMYLLQFFKNDECDASGFGEGKTHILNKEVITSWKGGNQISNLAINAKVGDYITSTARDPQNNTSEFSQCILVSWLLATSTSPVALNETESSQTYIPMTTSSTTFSSEWPGSDVIMTLIAPSGRVITRETIADDVEHENGATYEYYTITDPEPGDWTVELFGADVSSDGEEVLLTVTGAPAQPMQTMAVDIKPDDDNNTINCTNMNGVIPVAILTSDEFDATTIDHSTVRFGKYGSEAAEIHYNKDNDEYERHEEDVDNDGDIDLVFHFKYGETNLGCDDEFAVLTGSTYDGVFFTGADNIQSASNNGSVQPTDENSGIPVEFALKQPYPNPFNPTTTINYALPEPSKVIITIYDIRGRKIRELINNSESAGYKSIVWDGLNDYGKMVSGGIYIYHLKAGQYSSSKKLLFLK